MAANNPTEPVQSARNDPSAQSVPAQSKRYFDYVSADFIDEVYASAPADFMDLLSFYNSLDAFFKKMGQTDIIVFKKTNSNRAVPLSPTVQNLFDYSADSKNGIRYHKGVEIEADNENMLHSLIRKERPNADFIAVRSSDEKVIRAASESPDTDLVIPVSYAAGRSQNGGSGGGGSSSGSGSGGLYVSAGQINHIVAKIARDKKTAFGFDLYPFLQTKGYRRSKLFADCMDMIPVLQKYGVPVLTVSGAFSFYDARGAYECEAFGVLLGLSREETRQGVSDFPAEIIERRKKQRSGQIIASGVEILTEDRQD